MPDGGGFATADDDGGALLGSLLVAWEVGSGFGTSGGVDDADGEPPPEPWRSRKLPSTSTPTSRAAAPIHRPGPGAPRGATGSGGSGSAYGAGSTEVSGAAKTC